VRQAHALLARPDQGAFEIAGNFTEKVSVRGGVNRLRHRSLRARGSSATTEKQASRGVPPERLAWGRRYAMVFVSTPLVPFFPPRCPPVRRDLPSRYCFQLLPTIHRKPSQRPRLSTRPLRCANAAITWSRIGPACPSRSASIHQACPTPDRHLRLAQHL
jgi:hypothetical protein